MAQKIKHTMGERLNIRFKSTYIPLTPLAPSLFINNLHNIKETKGAKEAKELKGLKVYSLLVPAGHKIRTAEQKSAEYRRSHIYF